MNTKSRNMLLRLLSLEEEDGLRRAKTVVRVLAFAGLALFIFIVLGIVYQLPSIARPDWFSGPPSGDMLTGSSLRRIYALTTRELSKTDQRK
jgi:hypothetical protein